MRADATVTLIAAHANFPEVGATVLPEQLYAHMIEPRSSRGETFTLGGSEDWSRGRG
jgi:hypothetical protein